MLSQDEGVDFSFITKSYVSKVVKLHVLILVTTALKSTSLLLVMRVCWLKVSEVICSWQSRLDLYLFALFHFLCTEQYTATVSTENPSFSVIKNPSSLLSAWPSTWDPLLQVTCSEQRKLQHLLCFQGSKAALTNHSFTFHFPDSLQIYVTQHFESHCFMLLYTSINQVWCRYGCKGEKTDSTCFKTSDRLV